MDTTTLPLVTIAIPTFNRAATYLRPCLEGVLRQTYPHLEVIVSDNGSTDGTEALVKRYSDPRIRYFKQGTNIVPNENFNFCLREARGDYFQLLLDDELIDPDFVETCLRTADFRADFGLLRTGLRTVDARGHVIHESPNLAGGTDLANFFLAWFGGHTALYLCNTLFHRETLVRVGGFESRHNLFQDVKAQVQVAALLPRADSPLVKSTTRVHAGQHTRSATVRAWCEDSLDLLDLMCRVVPTPSERLLRRRGMRFFATIGYSRANALRASIARFRAYAAIYQIFGRRYLPPVRMLITNTAVYRSLRQVKRRILGMPAWVD